jgi:hypothetical protein
VPLGPVRDFSPLLPAAAKSIVGLACRSAWR